MQGIGRYDRRRMIRGISTKWMLGVLISLALPLVLFAWFARTEVTTKRADEVVRTYLEGTAADLAGQLQTELFERNQDVELLVVTPIVRWFMENGNATAEEYGGDDSTPAKVDRVLFRGMVEELFNDLVELSGVYERVLALDREGRGGGLEHTLRRTNLDRG